MCGFCHFFILLLLLSSWLLVGCSVFVLRFKGEVTYCQCASCGLKLLRLVSDTDSPLPPSPLFLLPKRTFQLVICQKLHANGVWLSSRSVANNKTLLLKLYFSYQTQGERKVNLLLLCVCDVMHCFAFHLVVDKL